MKKYLLAYSVLFCGALVFFNSCKQDENVLPKKGNVSFSLSQATRSNGRISETLTPTSVLLSITDSQGNIQHDTILSLFPFGQNYISEPLELPINQYRLTQFAILDATHKIIYATPKEGSDLAKYVTDPLPIKFEISQNASTQVIPQVLAITPDDTPEDFGYTTFGFEVVGNSSTVLIKTAVKLLIGDVIYENLDAHVRIKGYDSNNTVQWTKDYDFIGPYDTLEAKNGFHHYSIELVDKWGANDIQSDIPAKDIWDGRANGSRPVTYILGGKLSTKKLSMCVTSRETNVNGVGIVYQFESRNLYTYTADGHLEYIHHQTYDKQTSQFTETSTDAFIYDRGVVSKIITTLNGQPYSEYQRIYGNKYENKLTLKENGLEWTLITTHANNDSTDVNANYNLSNGNSFLYAFNFSYKNINSDKTIQSGELCNQGSYLYDKNINPFAHLGYTDFFLENWSINNKLTETIDYKACSFPELRPLSHQYTYDQDGYPIKEITTYQGGLNGFGHNNTPSPYHSELDFYYE